jgi:hypothetical protein
LLNVDHPVGHVSFASTHGKAPFTAIEVPTLHAKDETLKQMLWPDHCIQGTHVSAVGGLIGNLDPLLPDSWLRGAILKRGYKTD